MSESSSSSTVSSSYESNGLSSAESGSSSYESEVMESSESLKGSERQSSQASCDEWEKDLPANPLPNFERGKATRPLFTSFFRNFEGGKMRKRLRLYWWMVCLGFVLLFLQFICMFGICFGIFYESYIRRSGGVFPEFPEGGVATQSNEVANPKLVIMNVPGIEAFVGSINPAGALFQKGFNLGDAREQILHLQTFLLSQGINVLNARDVVASLPTDVLARIAREHVAYISMIPDPDLKMEEVLSDAYKMETLLEMSPENLVDIILLNPTVTLNSCGINTCAETESTAFKPLYNLLFTRDQQIITKRGIVMGNLNSEQRREESTIMTLVWETLGYENIFHLPSQEMKLEGGDFFPMGDDLCFIGVGLRTNMLAVEHLLAHDLFGTTRVAVVVDEFDKHQDRMHLDTVFNVVENSGGSKIVVLLEQILYNLEGFVRKVHLYVKNEAGEYELDDDQGPVLTFPQFLQAEGFEVIPVSHEEQLDYMINFLHLGRGIGLISNHEGLREKIRRYSNVNVHYFPFDQVQAMYGAAHCTTQVIRE